MNWVDKFPKRRRRGSFPRCLLFMEDKPANVAQKLNSLIGLEKVNVSAEECWMPKGIPQLRSDGTWDLTPTKEAVLGEDKQFLKKEKREAIMHWWLEVIKNANTPNWDIASTCTVNGTQSLLLIEAKAHLKELSLGGKSTNSNKDNHAKIGMAIEEANNELNKLCGGWNLSRDSHYQLSNRFAWAWKLASMQIPVILVYLGFLGANEMVDIGQPFRTSDDWEKAVHEYCRGIVPEAVWREPLNIGGTPIHALIRSIRVDLP